MYICMYIYIHIYISQPSLPHNILFHPRSQHGDYPYIPRKNWPHTPKNSMQSFEVRLEAEVKALLHANFNDNPLK